MKASAPTFPSAVLLRQYREAGLPSRQQLAADPRLGAILSARADWLNELFLDAATDPALADRLARFYEAVVPFPFHVDDLRRNVGFVRHGVNHLLRGADPLPTRLERCAGPAGAYRVAGLGMSFWAAIAQACDPDRTPGWSADTSGGLRRLGLLPKAGRGGLAQQFAPVEQACRRLLLTDPGLAAWQLDHFLRCVNAMSGRELDVRSAGSEVSPAGGPRLIAYLTRQERTRTPLRRRVKEWGERLRAAREQLEAALREGDPQAVVAAFAAIAGPGTPRRAADLPIPDVPLERVEHILRAGNVDEAVKLADDESDAAGWESWLPTLLHLRDANRFPLWDQSVRQAYALLDDAFDPCAASGEGYRLFAAGARWLCERHRLHPAELPGLLAALSAHAEEPERADARPVFAGFCSDSFRFLAELELNNGRPWMDRQRERYQFAVREPMVELCRALADAYVEPVLNGELGWGLVTEARTGKALTSIVKNDYGQTVPYQPLLWLTFFRRGAAGRRADAQLFVRLDAAGLTFGFHLGRTARDAGRRFRRNVQEHGAALFQALQQTGALKQCWFRTGEAEAPVVVNEPGGLRAWVTGKTLFAGRSLPPDAPQLRSLDLVGDVLLTFDRLLPLYAFAAEDDPVPLLNRRYRLDGAPAVYDRAAFTRATYLGDGWVDRALELLELKRQLILQGVPGTGKTHVASQLARLLTGDRQENLRQVQFHPAFSYEEFVEGIRPRTVEVNGRSEVTFPVEDGVLLEFAARAAERPAEPHVLLVDEINRGNLPRIFGELLYLLEYRGRSLTLPYSRRPFRLPPNLYLVGTMNASDRSVTPIDQALRRRFSFLDMPADPRILASWLAEQRHTDDEFPARLLNLFEALNAQLAADFGPGCQVGHSAFMVAGLDEAKLNVVWEHHVRPLIESYAAGHPARVAAYDLDALLNRRRKPLKRPASNAHHKDPAGVGE